jgi:hypothetical protein
VVAADIHILLVPVILGLLVLQPVLAPLVPIIVKLPTEPDREADPFPEGIAVILL